MARQDQTVVESSSDGAGSVATFAPTQAPTIPVSFVPTPTLAYRTHRKRMKTEVEPGLPIPIPIPIPIPPLMRGARVLMWKQDPSVDEIGIRKAYLPVRVFTGPRDARITTQGLAPVSPNVVGDLIETPGTDAFDAVHTFAVVRQTLTLYQRALGSAVPWEWNSATNTDPLQVFPHAGVTMNAYYDRNARALKFFYFQKPGDPPTAPPIYTCRSLDIVAHETGHAILDGLKPSWLGANNPPQTGALHESFGDLTAIFLALSQFDQVEAVIAQTKANLHDKTFLSDLAEQFGLALGRPNGLRNADNDLTLSQVGTEVHALSQVFTGGIYDVLADIFVFERNVSQRDDAAVLYDAARYLHSALLRAIDAAPATAATFADVVNQMLVVAANDGKPVQYRNFIRNRFTLREVVVSPTPLTEDHEAGLALEPGIQDDSNAVQNRIGCCGTMQLAEYTDGEDALEAERAELLKAIRRRHAGSNGKARSR
jgi:hypothetical protein